MCQPAPPAPPHPPSAAPSLSNATLAASQMSFIKPLPPAGNYTRISLTSCYHCHKPRQSSPIIGVELRGRRRPPPARLSRCDASHDEGVGRASLRDSSLLLRLVVCQIPAASGTRWLMCPPGSLTQTNPQGSLCHVWGGGWSEYLDGIMWSAVIAPGVPLHPGSDPASVIPSAQTCR